LSLIKSALLGDSPTGFRALRITNPDLQRFLKRDNVHDLLGSNLSVTASALFRVNGYSELIEGYWGEDGDLFIRLRNAGVKCLGLKSMAIQYHLWHERRAVNPEKSAAYARAVLDTTTVRCEKGIT